MPVARGRGRPSGSRSKPKNILIPPPAVILLNKDTGDVIEQASTLPPIVTHRNQIPDIPVCIS